MGVAAASAGRNRLGRSAFHGLERADVFDEDECAPELAVGRFVVALSIARGDDGETAARDVADAALGELAVLVIGDALKIVHEADGVFEHLVVDALVDVADVFSALLVRGGVGLVDVADLARLGVRELTVDVELAGDIEKTRRVVSGHGATALQKNSRCPKTKR